MAEALIISGFMAAAIIAAATATATRDPVLTVAGWMMVANCALSNILIANYESVRDLEQYVMVPGLCYVTVYLLNLDAKRRWLSVLHYMFLAEMLVGLACATESLSHLTYFVVIDVLFLLECIVIIVAAFQQFKQPLKRVSRGNKWIKNRSTRSHAAGTAKPLSTRSRLRRTTWRR